MTIMEVVHEDVHEISEVDVVDLEGFALRVAWHERTVEIGVVIVAHVIDEGAGYEPVSWSTDSIAFENLELGL